MSYSNGVNMVKESARRTYLSLHDQKTDEELTAIVRYNCSAVLSMQDELAAAKLLGEAEACNELLKRREEKKNRHTSNEAALNRAKLHWRDALEERKLAVAEKLQKVSGYHSQLVAAVLEEKDGQTASEIRQWFQDLLEMEDTAYEQLLADMCSAGVVKRGEDDQYYLLTICAGDMLPVDLHFWVSKTCREKGISLTSQEEAFIDKLIEKKTPLSDYDWVEINYKQHSSYYERKRNELAEGYSGIHDLRCLVEKGLLARYPGVPQGRSLYYFPILGEEAEK